MSLGRPPRPAPVQSLNLLPAPRLRHSVAAAQQTGVRSGSLAACNPIHGRPQAEPGHTPGRADAPARWPLPRCARAPVAQPLGSAMTLLPWGGSGCSGASSQFEGLAAEPTGHRCTARGDLTARFNPLDAAHQAWPRGKLPTARGGWCVLQDTCIALHKPCASAPAGVPRPPSPPNPPAGPPSGPGRAATPPCRGPR